jgi:23S rRNA (uracil1939-C5)-methyltransferase
MEKNDIVRIEITDMTMEGEGIGHYEEMALFVKDAVIGDVVDAKIMKMKKNYGYARLMQIVTPSKDRVKPLCPIARQCGGCQIQEMSYAKQLEFKQKLVVKNLERIGRINPQEYELEPIIGMKEPFRYRNKAQFPVGTNSRGETVIGFYAGRTHAIMETEDCLLGSEKNAGILAIVKEYMKECSVRPYQEEDGTGLVRHILIREGYKTGQIMVCLVINGEKLPNVQVLIQKLLTVQGMASIMTNTNKNRTNVILGNKVNLLWGKPYIEDYIGDVLYQISPLSFFQVNPQQTEKLYGKALEYAGLTGTETVWDLYCGIGTISLFLAQKAKKVYGVEIVPAAIEDAKRNATLNHIENAEFFVGKAEEVLPDFYEKESAKTGQKLTADVIVVDPPRKGCDEALLQTIVKMEPKRVVYVSCDSATLARDLKILRESGYEVRKVQAVDQFGNSVHVEALALLVRERSDRRSN